MMREDWVQVNIESVFKKLDNGKEINQGWSPQCKNYPSSSEDIWGVLKTTAIQKNEFWDHENKELPKDKEARAHLEVKAGDIILTCAGPRNRCGVACTVIKTRPKLLLSGKMYRFRPDERVMTTEFLTFFLQTQESWSEIDKMKTGTSDSGLNLTQGRFRKLPIKIAPLPEQRSIVTKIEELFSDLDKGVADLKKAQDQLKVYRQAVLKKAFEGLEKETTLEEIKEDSLIGLVRASGLQNSNGEGTAYLKMDKIDMIGNVELEDLVYVETNEDEIEKYALKTGDILLNTRNSYELVGKTGIVRNINKTVVFNNNIMRIRVNESYDPYFICYQLISPFVRKQMDKLKKATTSVCALYQRNLFPLKLKVIDIKEQHQIIQEIESRLSVCDKVEESIIKSIEKAEALRQSILKKAFEGNLLSTQEIEKCKTEPDYEPAAVLLEKIKMNQ